MVFYEVKLLTFVLHDMLHLFLKYAFLCKAQVNIHLVITNIYQKFVLIAISLNQWNKVYDTFKSTPYCEEHLQTVVPIPVLILTWASHFISLKYSAPSGQFSSVQFTCSVMSDWLYDPMNHSPPGLPVHHQLPEFTQTQVHWVGDVIQPSHPYPLSPPALNLS